MATLFEYVGNIHIFLGPYRGNPIALYLMRGEGTCHIAPKVYPWNEVVGVGETPNRAAFDFEEKWKATGRLAADMYDGPSWEGVKPEKPAPPKPATPPKPAAPATPAAGADSAAADTSGAAPAATQAEKVTAATVTTASAPPPTPTTPPPTATTPASASTADAPST